MKLVAPCGPLAGLKAAVIAAGPTVTVKALLSETTSVPVVTETFRVPRVVVGDTVMLACSDVALSAVTELTVTPVPKLATLQLGVHAVLAKCVNCPVSVTFPVKP